MIHIICPNCGDDILFWNSNRESWSCKGCNKNYSGIENSYVDLYDKAGEQTSDHYSLQWGEELGFLKFIQDQERAKSVMPAARLGWDKLFSEIRNAAETGPTSVYDAACGFGGITNELLNEKTCSNLMYVGADIHGSISAILERLPLAKICGLFFRWDISEVLPIKQSFDYVICRASIHHTPNPRKTFRSLCLKLKPGGTIAISAYRRKGICREAMDDVLRSKIGSMTSSDAFQVCEQFTILGKALQEVTQHVEISEDLPLLDVPKGSYSVQALVYYHILKCFYNPTFGDKYSTLVNYDWYHPQYAYRYAVEELQEWFEENNVEILESQTIDVQHFLTGRLKK